MRIRTIILLNPDVLQPRFASPDELALWADVSSDEGAAPMPMVREERLDWLAMVTCMEDVQVVLIGDHDAPRPKDLDLRSLTSSADAGARLRGSVYSAADVPNGILGRLGSIMQVLEGDQLITPGLLTPDWRRIIWADSELGDAETRAIVRETLREIAGHVVLVEPSPSYGLLPGDLWEMSRAVGLMLPSHGFNAPPPGPPRASEGELF